VPTNINLAGTIAGFYEDASHVLQGFLRFPNGTLTAFEAPGAGTGSYEGTEAFSVNPAGLITGTDFDANNVAHGFLLAP
jgi:hypothetical protein